MPNRVPLYSWVAASIISVLGNRLTNLAIPWFVLETTGSASKAGITGFFSILPVVLAAFLGGPIIERVGYKRVSILSDILSGITVALVPLLHHTVGLSFWQLQVLVFLGAFLDAPGSTARRSMIPELSQEAGLSLERVNSLVQIAERLAMLGGPLVGGILIGLVGASNVLWFDAATFAVSALVIRFGIPAGLVPAAKPAEGGGLASYTRDLAEGIRFIRQDRLVFTMLAVITLTNFLESPLSGVLLPAYFEQVLQNPTALGAVLSALGAGSIVGAGLYAAFGPRFSRRWIYLSAWILVALPQLIMAQLPPLPAMIGLAVLLGLGSGPLNPIIETVLQERVPADMRGRVFGMTVSMAWMAMPLGPMIAGFTVDLVGIQPTYIAIAAAYVIVALTQVLNRSLKEMDRPPAADALQHAKG